MKYAYLDKDGFVCFVFDGQQAAKIDGYELVEIDYEIGNPPFDFAAFNHYKKSWEDKRTENEKYLFSSDEIQSKRKLLLNSSDWTQIPNGPLTQEQQQAWAVYRQQLRDITTQSGYPFNVIWPTQPE